MKKIIALLLVFCMLSGGAVYAVQKVSSVPDGVAFMLSDDWEKLEGTQFGYRYKGGDEQFVISSVNVGYTMDDVDEAYLRGFCEQKYSDDRLAAYLPGAAAGTVKTESIVDRMEYFGKRLFYRYEKASEIGGKKYYFTTLLTVENGRIYEVIYTRNRAENHFSEVSDMLNTIDFSNGAIKILVNANPVESDSVPLIIDDRTVVPIRAVAERMGYKVAWDADEQLVTLTEKTGAIVLKFYVGKNVAYRNDEKLSLDVPPVMRGNRTYLPVRAVAEAMFARVNWIEDTKTIVIIAE